MKEFGLQLYSIRDHFDTVENTKDAFKQIAKMGYTVAQTAGVYDYITPEEFANAAREAGVYICGTHYNWQKIRSDFEGTVAYHKALGTTNIGIGGMPEEAKANLASLNAFIDEFNALASKYYAEGFKLTYHNHSFEFKKLEDGRTLFDHLVEKLDPETTSFVLDTYWVQHGGGDVRATIELLKGRIDILHIKDMEACVSYKLEDGSQISAPAITEIGAGNINFKDIIPTAERCGVKYFVVEDDRCPGPYGESYIKTEKAAEYIKANLLEK